MPERLTVSVQNGKDGRKWRIAGTVSLSGVVAGALPHKMASPTGNADSYWELAIVGDTRRAA